MLSQRFVDEESCASNTVSTDDFTLSILELNHNAVLLSASEYSAPSAFKHQALFVISPRVFMIVDAHDSFIFSRALITRG